MQVNADSPSYDHSLSGIAVDAVLKTSAVRRSADNITVVFIAFDNFFKLVKESRGDITKFEPTQIQLSMIELLQPPDAESSARSLAQAKQD